MVIHKLHLYTGEGKGKTTAAMGLALRSLGHGYGVFVAQFLKDGRSGELAALRQLPGATVYAAKPLEKFAFRMTEEERARAADEQSGQARALAALIADARPDVTVLDELALALHMGMVGEPQGRALIDAALSSGECVVTGRYAPDWLRGMADYVSVITPERHPYDTQKLMARKGIEW